jgi:hypothetical protein
MDGVDMRVLAYSLLISHVERYISHAEDRLPHCLTGIHVRRIILCTIAKMSFLIQQSIPMVLLWSLPCSFVTVCKASRPRPQWIEHVLVLPKTA